jgi:hypothetical protein
MLEQPFYHTTIRNTVISFGNLFSKLKLQRIDQSGIITQTIAVPITYGNKEKIFVRLRQESNFENQVAVTLPRMAFEITSYTHDQSRFQSKLNKITAKNPDGSTNGMFVSTPYNLGVALYILTKGSEDGLNIIEQILPIFNPEYILPIVGLSTMGLVQDVPVVLNSVSSQTEFEGDFMARSLTTYQLDFTVKINLYGKIGNATEITRTDVSLKANMSNGPADLIHTAIGNPEDKTITDFWN